MVLIYQTTMIALPVLNLTKPCLTCNILESLWRLYQNIHRNKFPDVDPITTQPNNYSWWLGVENSSSACNLNVAFDHCLYFLTCTHNNNTKSLSSGEDDNKKQLSQTNAQAKLQIKHAIQCMLLIKHDIDNYGMLDSGTTGNFIAMKIKVKNVCPTSKLVNVVTQCVLNMIDHWFYTILLCIEPSIQKRICDSYH